jgi:hypothetical protein
VKTVVGHAKHDDCDVYIGRQDEGRKTIQNAPPGDCWGNPYTLEDHSRGASIRKFADLLETLLEERPIYRLHVRDLTGKTLGCWCRRVNESEPACHGDVLAARANHLHEQLSTAEGETCERGEHWLIQYRQWRECVWCGTSGQTLSGDRAIDRTGAYLWPRDDDEAHHVSAVSDEVNKTDGPNKLNKPDRADKPDSSVSHSPVEEDSDSGNPSFERDKPAAHRQERAAVASHHAPDERGQRGGQG